VTTVSLGEAWSGRRPAHSSAHLPYLEPS
jgi:hypothetical protein